jgi:DNA-binding transcriptional regulator WhiA
MKHIEKLQEFLTNELQEYFYFKYEIHFQEELNGYEYYRVEVKSIDKREKDITFKISDDSIMVCVNEDIYMVTESHNYNVKYFWMALLSWDI